ncbi:MAG: hypothetical protein JRD93_17055 [Deltaproteobacteria bacterium]|nr:hypothetical protein [Deltaproteobacteria bacterium]
MAVVKRKVCRRESQRGIVSGKLEKNGAETVNSAASAAYLNKGIHPIAIDRGECKHSIHGKFTI